eukprot:CAMPEP_0170554952 /NCGR_PEP_ID=MMETSP0211-20121228/12834_1 /TAXON_ID=311385 /ORGANISM="Pseudokeronopsis sp., Strain OXSARD2" /LENGTH=103 /DNA_ID=CAMNT_0010864415 /DNA_START=522 /DNA_END=831 /DNA_ORIENTATION=+
MISKDFVIKEEGASLKEVEEKERELKKEKNTQKKKEKRRLYQKRRMVMLKEQAKFTQFDEDLREDFETNGVEVDYSEKLMKMGTRDQFLQQESVNFLSRFFDY